jgi:CBS domain containing-hemolysin-like protein
MDSLVISIIVLVLGSAFCSSAEAALFSTPQSKIQALIKKGKKSAKNLLFIKENISSSIAAVVILNNIFNIIGTLYVGVIADQVFNNDLHLLIFSVVLTVIIILFGEILPKNFGEKFSLSYSLKIAGVLIILRFTFLPILWLIDNFSKLIFGKNLQQQVSEEEIKVMIDQGMESRGIEHDEHKLINNVFNLNDKTAKDIMTPRVNITAVESSESIKNQLEVITNSPHSRILVYKEDYDEIIGYILVREALEKIADKNFNIEPKDIIHEIIKVKETTKADSLLVMFQKKRVHLALVVDPFGGTAGLVTLEDVLEEIVGEIMDETDEVIDMREQLGE